jgi:diguanylate cyclase (GGDEF)-like protein/PAS domain S-box-containing protein
MSFNSDLIRSLLKVPIAFSHSDRDGRILTLSDRFVEIFGYTTDDVHTIDEWWPRAYPDPVHRQHAMDTWAAAMARSVAGGNDIPALTYEITCKDGRVRLVDVSGVVLEEGLIVTFVDVTERKQAEDVQRQRMRKLRASSEFKEALLRAEDEQALLDEFTRIICEEAGYRMAWVGYAESDDARTVRPRAWAGEEAGYLSLTCLTWADTPAGQRPFGIAIRSGRTSCAQDFSSEPWSGTWTVHALQRGYRSGIALPLKTDTSDTFGVLCVYSPQTSAFTPDEVKLLEELAGDLAFGIANLRARAAHRQAEARLAVSEQLFRAMVENFPEPIARYDRELRRVYANRAVKGLFAESIEQVLGATPAGGSPLVEPDSYMAAIRRVIATSEEQTLEGAARSLQGDIRWSDWRFTPEFGPDGQVATVLVISHDISERKQAEEERQAHLHFLESMDRVNRAIQGANDLDQMMSDVLDVVRGIFDCDRAFLAYPCDPGATHWTVPMERTRPEYPGVLALGQPIPMDKGEADTAQALLDSSGPILFGPGTGHALPAAAAARFSIKSILSMALHPKTGKPWQLGLHQCSRAREWTPGEIRLFEQVARRIADGLDNLLTTRHLRDSEERFRLVFENSPLPLQEEDFSAVKTRIEALRPAFGDDFEAYLAVHPELFEECTALVRVVDINRAAVQLHEADSKEALLAGLAQTFLPETADVFHRVLNLIARGETELTSETTIQTFKGRRQQVTVYFTVCPGYEHSFGRVLVSLIDISDRKRAELDRRSHLDFMVALDRVNRAIQGATSLDQMMVDVLDCVLEIFACDRAYLHYPCDPEATELRIPMERCSPAYPSRLKPGQSLKVDEHIAQTLRALLQTDHPIRLGPDGERPIPAETTDDLGVRSMMALALRPKVDRPWHFGIHQCSRARTWNEQEVRLFEEIGRRISDGLNSLLVTRSLRESEQLFRALVENSPDFIARYDGQLRRLYVNPALQRVFKTSPAETLGQSPISYSPLVDPSSYMASLKQAVEEGRECSGELAYRDLQGQLRWGTLRAVPEFDVNGVVSSVLAITRDISERVRHEEGLRLAASVFSTTQEGILISDAENRIIDVNPAFTRLTGYSREQAIGKDPSFLSARQQSPETYAAMWRDIETKGAWQGELWNQRKSGEIFAELLSIVAVKDQQGKLQHYVGVFSDISVIKAHEADLDRIAHFDTLTSVPNRRLLSDRLEQAIARSRRHGSNLAVCYLDLDGFKPINDQFGHEGGDRLLIEIAQRLQSTSRADDTVARLGGDEFVLLWNDIGAQAQCTHAIERVLAAVSAPVVIDGTSVSVSASIGVTLFPDDNVDADSLLRHADHAMYSAKQLGKNRYQLFDSRLEQQISSRVEFLAKVSRGLDREEFELFYQPKVDCVASNVIGVEALIRWNDPMLGLLGPKEFLPLIEDDSLALRMGRWVMQEAVRQARRWHEMGIDLCISINVFARHLEYPSFIEDLRNAVSAYWPQMPRDRLMLEIVETSDLEELDPIEAVIQECLQMGIPFSLDDFGTGYSSLIYLRRLSVEELKIDQSFVRDMLEDPDDRAIVVSVIGLGKAFGLRVVAEGVESQRHARHLIDLGCSVVQGFGLGHPMPVAELQDWLTEFRTQGVRIWR